MLFLGILNWLSSVPENLMGSVLKGVRSLMFALDSFIYKLIIDLYNIFSQLCTVRLLSSDVLSALSQRIGYVLGVVMLFYVVIGFIQMLVNPDNLNDKEKGAVSIIKRTIIVIVMLGSANFVFDLLFDLQKSVVQSNIISKLLLPYTISTNINNQTDSSGENSIMDNEQFGGLLSEELLTSFYRMEEFDSSSSSDLSTTDDGASIYDSCSLQFNSFRLQIINYHRFELGYVCLNEQINAQFLSTGATTGEDQETFVINFNWLLSPICGAAVVYLLFMYCLKVGVRMVQLMFLEIISPMAFVSYLAPKKDTMFSKWSKIYISTYIDVFIRIAIINFIFFLISTLFSSDSAWGIETTGLPDNAFVKVVLILALLTFAKKAPDLLKELMPAGASKLGFGLAMKDIVGLSAGVGALAGAATGGAIGFLGGEGIGAIGGVLRGAKAGVGAKGLGAAVSGARKAQNEVNKKVAAKRANGATWIGSHVGSSRAFDEDERRIAVAQERVDMYKNASSEAESEALKNGANYIIRSATAGGRTVSLAELDKLRNDQTLSATERTAYESEFNQLKKSATMFNLDYGRAVEKGSVEFNGDGSFYSMLGNSGHIYNSTDAVNAITNKNEEIGGRNATIDVNMSNLAGSATSGRGNAGKQIRNENSTFITEMKGSKSYKTHKANAGK